MKLKLLILSLFPILLLGQANLNYVRSYDSTFSIVNQTSPSETLWKFTKDGYLVRYENDIAVDTASTQAYSRESAGASSDSSLISYTDTLTLVGDTLSGINIKAKFKNFFANIGGFFGRRLEVDKATIDTLVLADVELDTVIKLKDAVEAESFDSINIGGYYIRFNKSEGIHEFVTAYGDVVWQGAFEDLIIGYNNTGSTIANFTPCYKGESIGDSIPTLGVSYASIATTALRFTGVATMDIPNGTVGVVCRRGYVRNGDASSLTTSGVTWLGEGVLTATKPTYPATVVIAGGCISTSATDGIIDVDISFALQRQINTKSYTFTSLSIPAGEYWKAGFYDVSATDANLTQASASITYGTADIAYEAHPFAVYGGAGSVTGGGRVALITIGTSYDDVTGSQTPADVDTVITDITNAALNIYDETKKYHGTVTYQLVVVEGAPSAYSLDFNYGYAKYDDLNDRDFYISAIEAVWIGDGSDATGMDIELYKHTQTGWTYAATGFEAGNGVLAQRSVDQTGFLRVASGVESAWKRSQLNEFIDGTGEEGYLIKVTTGISGTFQIMDIHVESAID